MNNQKLKCFKCKNEQKLEDFYTTDRILEELDAYSIMFDNRNKELFELSKATKEYFDFDSNEQRETHLMKDKHNYEVNLCLNCFLLFVASLIK